MFLRNLAVSLGLFLLAFAVWTTVSGQPSEESSVVVVTEIQIEPTRIGQFENALRKLKEAHQKLDTGASWYVLQSVSGEAFTFRTIRTYENWAGLDEAMKTGSPPQILIKAFGEEEGQRIANQALESFASMESGHWISRPDLALNSPE